MGMRYNCSVLSSLLEKWRKSAGGGKRIVEFPIHVCIGTEECADIPRKILEHSIRKNASDSTEIEFHHLTDSPELRDFGAATGFSFQRWHVPEYRDYKGWAIYLDADQMVFGDIRELWEIDGQYPNDQACMWCTYRSGHAEASVMLIDCEKARGIWPTIEEIRSFIKTGAKEEARKRYGAAMAGYLLKFRPQEITHYWNHLNEYEPGKTRLLHYTRQRTQPWRYPEHPLTGVWKDALLDAIRSGIVTKDEVVSACERFEHIPEKLQYNGMHPWWRSCLNEV